MDESKGGASAKLLRREYEKLIRSIESTLVFARNGDWEPSLEKKIRRANLIYPFREARELDLLITFEDWQDVETWWSRFLPQEFADLRRGKSVSEWDDAPFHTLGLFDEEDAILLLLKSEKTPNDLRLLLTKHLSVISEDSPLSDKEQRELSIAIGYCLASPKKDFAKEVNYSERQCRNYVKKYKSLIKKILGQ